MSSNTVRLVVECINLEQVLESIKTAASGWANNAPATRLVDMINSAGGVRPLARKIELQISAQGGGWLTCLTRSSGMSIIITQNPDSTLQILFAGEMVKNYRETFLQNVIDSARNVLVNARDFPEPRVMI